MIVASLAVAPAAHAALPPVKHVFLIVLENKNYDCATFTDFVRETTSLGGFGLRERSLERFRGRWIAGVRDLFGTFFVSGPE